MPGDLLVKLPAGREATALASLAASGARIRSTIPELGLVVVETPMRVPGVELTGQALAASAGQLVSETGAEWAEPNYTIELDADPNDPFYSTQDAYLKWSEMPDAWGITVGDPQIIIAVLDTGVDMAHPDLQGAIWTNPGEIPGNGVDDDHNGFIDDVHGWDFAGNDNDPSDDYGHGTHVAGIAAARINNGIGIAGMAGAATIMPVDVFNYAIGTYEDLIRAMVYATDNGARVINMSLGASSYSKGEEAAVDYAWSHGVVVVAAAGNSGGNNYHYPAAHPHAIAVAGTTASDGLYSSSSWGDFVDVSAPAVSVFSTYPGNSYRYMTGTSMATPHVSGLAALVLSLNPGLSPDEVRGLIESNADDLGTTGWDPYYGHGRINALKTLQAVPGGPLPPPTPPPPLTFWPAGCTDVMADGGFEALSGAWETSGNAAIDATKAYSGTYAAHFPGGAGAHGVLTQTVTLPPFLQEGGLWFAFQIDSQDNGWGSSASFPYDDWLTAEFRAADGRVIQSLLRTGNSADSSGDGLAWDRYLYHIPFSDLAPLRTSSTVSLVFTAASDTDSLPTSFWVDEVRFCVLGGAGSLIPGVMR